MASESTSVVSISVSLSITPPLRFNSDPLPAYSVACQRRISPVILFPNPQPSKCVCRSRCRFEYPRFINVRLLSRCQFSDIPPIILGGFAERLHSHVPVLP